MKLTDIPKLMAVPFGINGPREELLESSPAGNRSASYADGFPPITMLLKQAGGLPPKGENMNQILFELASGQRWSNSGAGYKFNATFSDAVGGYPKGAQILSNDGTKVYVSTKDDNKTDFNTSPGDGWVTLGDYIGLGDYATTEDLNKYLAKDQNGADIPDKDTFIKNLGLEEILAKKINFDDIARELSDDWYKVPSVSLLNQELGKKVSSTTFNQEMNKKADKDSLGTAAAKNTGNGTGQIPDMSYFPFSGKGTDSIVVTLPNGLIIQAFKREVVSSVNVGEGKATPINFPAAFPNKVIAVVCAKSSYVQIIVSCEDKTLSGFSAVAMKATQVDVTYSMADFIVLGN